MNVTARACDRMAFVAIVVATLALLATVLIAHRTPLLGAETDLLGDSVPAARALASGRFSAGTFEFRGPGYPLMLAAGSRLTGGDEFLAARILNVAAAVAALAIAYGMFRVFLGPLAGLGVLLGLATSPVFVRAAIEAGTDMPALALALGATLAVTRSGWRSCAAAGALAGCAYLTRANMAFLAPAGIASLLVARAGPGRLLAFIAGLVVPVAGWTIAHALVAGGLPHNRNYANVAYEVYGRGMSYEQFWVQTSASFHSFIDVALFDPARFARHIARNVLTRWLDDAHQLMPVWIGAPALIGMVLAWRRRAGWMAMAIHFALAYLVLTLVFYNPRFFLYLLPFYLSGTFGLLLIAPSGASGTRRWSIALAAALIVASLAVTCVGCRKMLADSPDETRVAGMLLRNVGHPGQRVMARKPHVAYFAGMDYLPLPRTDAIWDFLIEARKARADYLFISGIEVALSPQLSLLADGVPLPGLKPLTLQVLRPSHFMAVYRIVPQDVTREVFDDSLVAALEQFVARRPGEAWARTYMGGQLVDMGRYREALAPLAAAERLDSRDVMAARFQAISHAQLGELDQAAAACERALALAPSSAWDWGQLGQIQLRLGRYAEARGALKRAMEGAPTDPRYPLQYLAACAGLGAWPEVAAMAEQILRSAPGDATARLFAARAWLGLGRPERARALAAMPAEASGPDSARWAQLADSLRTGAPLRGP